ncbi:hypothetical protein YC2023_071139 [Brassica napus]
MNMQLVIRAESSSGKDTLLTPQKKTQIKSPVVKGMKSEKKFAGARYTTSVEKLVVVYKVQRCLTSHSQIKKEKVKGVANSWAYSAITIGVMILTYGDDKGLVNPPNVAPIQVRLSEEGNGLDVCDS